jgi:transposase
LCVRSVTVGLFLKELTVNSIGIDLHRKSITICVMNKDRKVLSSQTLPCCVPEEIVKYMRKWVPFQAVIEATASYEWLYQLLEPFAERIVLAHPGKLRIIAESTRKSDKLDARVLAEFLVLDMIPQAYRPNARQRDHRRLIRYRAYLQGRITSVRCRIRALLADYNANRKDLFTVDGLGSLQKVKLSDADRFVLDEMLELWDFLCRRMKKLEKQLTGFVKAAPAAEREARQILDSIPGVGPVTIEVVVSELGSVERFKSNKRVCAYAGLVPGQRESGGKCKELGITKAGSPLLRWALIEASWRLVRTTARWRSIFQALLKRKGKKRAIVAVARRLLCVMASMLRSGKPYRLAA